MADLIVKAAVKEALDDKNVSSDFYGALDDEVTELLEDAARRAEANDRKTVQPRDLELGAQFRPDFLRPYDQRRRQPGVSSECNSPQPLDSVVGADVGRVDEIDEQPVFDHAGDTRQPLSEAAWIVDRAEHTV